MDSIVEYLIKSGVALLVFYLFYWIFMRKSTHFGLNRLTLSLALIASLVLPFIHIDLTPEVTTSNLQSITLDLSNVVQVISKPEPAWGIREFVLLVYFSGVLITLSRLIYQSIYIHVMANMSKTIKRGSHTIVLVEKDITPFAYFSKIFIPDSKTDESAFESILKHEQSHLRQYHYLDLFLIEIITIVQWFNPVVWLYESSVKEVHEFLADDDVLKQGISKGNYQALLVNQALGGPVFTISHQFNQSLIKKRIVMMTKIKTPKLAKIKVLLLAPLTAGLLMAFSNPDPIVNPVVEKVEQITNQLTNTKFIPGILSTKSISKNEEESVTISGRILDEATKQPIKGASVLVRGTSISTTSDANGHFKITANGSKADLLFTQIGYATVLKAYTQNATVEINLGKETLHIVTTGVELRDEKQEIGIKPDTYIVIDGVPSNQNILTALDPEKIESISVLKGEKAFALYGEKGKDGVILITTKKSNSTGSGNDTKVNSQFKTTGEQLKDNNQSVFSVVEDMPSFPGGNDALSKFISTNLKISDMNLPEGKNSTVYLAFIIRKDGKVDNVKVIQGLGKSFDEEALRVINLMPKWIPGKQNGKAVDTYFNMPINFKK